MKYLGINKKWIVILILPFLLVMCMTIEKISHPDNPQVNSKIEIGVDIKLESDTEDYTELVFGVLAPKSWNVADNAGLTFTSDGYSGGDVTEEEMILMTDSDKEPTTLLNWSQAFQSDPEIGFMGNVGPVEWVVFRSQTKFNIVDDDVVKAKIRIKLRTGSENIKLNMGYVFCGKNNGLADDYYDPNAKSKVITVLGGTNELIDYTSVSLVSTTPGSFAWGDIVAINFETKSGKVETPLHDVERVYLYGKVVYYSGKLDSSVVDIINDKTLMGKVGETTWQKYIYAKDFFQLPEDAVIEQAFFHFTNEDKSVIVKSPTGQDFFLKETCE